MKRVFSFLLTLCLLLTALLSGAALAEGSTQITIGLVGEPDTIIPYMYTADKDAMVIMQMMPYLFKRNDETSIPEPLMLESCEFDADTLTYTWKLREGYTWTDGEPLTIDDVIFTLNTLASADYTGGASTNVSSIAGYAEAHSGETVGMSGVQKVDDYTMTVQLSAWDPTFLGYYCDPGAILPEHVLSGVSFSDWAKTDFAEHPVTYGPYKLVTWEHGEYIKLVKNEAWAGEPAQIDTVIFRFAESATTFVNAYMNGEIDMFKAPIEDVETLAFMDNTKTYVCSGSNYPLYPNLIKGPLSDVEVRRAILYSYTPETIAKAVFGDYGEGSCSVFVNRNWAADKSTYPYTEDHDKAKSILEADGYVMGNDGYYQKDGVTLAFTSLCTGSEQNDLLTLWQSSLKKSGIKVNIKLVDWSVMVETISNQETADYGTYTFGGGDGDPSGLMVLYCSDFDAAKGGFNFNRCGDETLDALWYAGQAETDQAKCTEIYHEINTYMLDNALLFPFVEKNTVWVANGTIDGVVINSLSNLVNLPSFTK